MIKNKKKFSNIMSMNVYDLYIWDLRLKERISFKMIQIELPRSNNNLSLLSKFKRFIMIHLVADSYANR